MQQEHVIEESRLQRLLPCRATPHAPRNVAQALRNGPPPPDLNIEPPVGPSLSERVA